MTCHSYGSVNVHSVDDVSSLQEMLPVSCCNQQFTNSVVIHCVSVFVSVVVCVPQSRYAEGMLRAPSSNHQKMTASLVSSQAQTLDTKVLCSAFAARFAEVTSCLGSSEFGSAAVG